MFHIAAMGRLWARRGHEARAGLNPRLVDRAAPGLLGALPGHNHRSVIGVPPIDAAGYVFPSFPGTPSSPPLPPAPGVPWVVPAPGLPPLPPLPTSTALPPWPPWPPVFKELPPSPP